MTEAPFVFRTHIIGSALGSTPEGLHLEDNIRRDVERRRRDSPYQALVESIAAEFDRLVLFGNSVVL